MGLFSSIFKAAAPIVGGAFGGPVGSAIGSAVAGGIGQMGNSRARGYDQQAAQAQLQAMRPFGTSGLFGSSEFDEEENNLAFNLSDPRRSATDAAIRAGTQNLSALNSMNFGEREQAELGRLRSLREPQIRRAREALMARQLSRGRLGLGVGGGRTGGLFNPQTAALEEAVLSADLGDIGAARQFSQQEQGFLQNQASGLFNTANQIGQPLLSQAALGIQARGGAAAGQAAGQPFQNQAANTRGFFSSLGTTLGGAIEGIGQQASRPQTQYPTVYGRDGYGQYF
jgi:hypothetical protein